MRYDCQWAVGYMALHHGIFVDRGWRVVDECLGSLRAGVGDVCEIRKGGNAIYWLVTDADDAMLSNDGVRVIMRNGKVFIWPEEE